MHRNPEAALNYIKASPSARTSLIFPKMISLGEDIRSLFSTVIPSHLPCMYKTLAKYLSCVKISGKGCDGDRLCLLVVPMHQQGWCSSINRGDWRLKAGRWQVRLALHHLGSGHQLRGEQNHCQWAAMLWGGWGLIRPLEVIGKEGNSAF